MPKVAFFIYSLGVAERVQGEQREMNIVNPTYILQPDFIPGNFSFAVATSIFGIDADRPHKLRLRFFHSEDRELVVFDTGESDIPPIRNEDSTGLPEELRGIQLAFELRNVVFRKTGRYEASLEIDGEVLGVYEVYVYPRESVHS